ncbi:helix-turn-helix domain-containing protein [Paenibacillus sp. FSL M7-0896]|uniref:helix-turn-helix domain-containing protein n=1 Tax=Paenibacillus sp. FSL M7-0896 TaxID=2921610 RepID=UPI0030DA5F0E
MGYYSTREASLILNFSTTAIIGMIKKGEFQGAVQGIRRTWLIPKQEVDQMASIPYSDYYKASEAANLIQHNKQKVLKMIHSGELKTAVFRTPQWWIHKKEIDDLADQYKKWETEYLTTSKVAEQLDHHTRYILLLINSNMFPNAVFFKKAWRIPLSDVDDYQKTCTPEGFLTSQEAAEILGLTISGVNTNAALGKFSGAYKKGKKWLYPEHSVNQVLEQRRVESQVLSSVELFQKEASNFENPPHLRKTLLLFKEFALTKLSASKASEENQLSSARQLAALLKTLIPLLNKEIVNLSDHEIVEILKRTTLNHLKKVFLSQFLQYCSGTTSCKFKNQYREVRNKQEEQEIYSPDIFFSYYNYVRDFQYHLDHAITDRRYAVTWLYILIHMIDAWRKSDILNFPPVPIEVVQIESFHDFSSFTFTHASAQALLNQIASRIERMYVSKTGALGHFIVNEDMQIPTAIALTICELHRRKEEDPFLLRFGFIKTKNINQVKHYHFKNFFKNKPELIHFSSLKMNRSLLTYFFHSITEGKDNADISYYLAQRLRSHLSEDTTATYIQSINNDGSLDRVSINLFNRGHFGWLYNFMLRLCITTPLSMEQQTLLISQLQLEYTPPQLEGLAYFLKKQHSEKHSLALKIAQLPKDELYSKVLKIFKGELPAKIKNAQCFTYPKCSYPTAISCMHCDYIIPKTYLMISIAEEIHKRIHSLTCTPFPAVRIRESTMLYKVLDLLLQAKQELGQDYIEQFIHLEDLESKLIFIDRLLLTEESE